jgi:hypothetical protein
MADYVESKRHTCLLVRSTYKCLSKNRLSATDIYNLCRLTWITSSNSGTTYVKTVKLPALRGLFNVDENANSLDQVARRISDAANDASLLRIITNHTGFTNIYNVYRKTAAEWIKDNEPTLQKLIRKAYSLQTDDEARDIIRQIENLGSIAAPNDINRSLPPSSLLTPLIFCLDPRLRFPIINGRENVKRLLAYLKLQRAPLPEQFDGLVSLIGGDGIKDAAELDEYAPQQLPNRRANCPLQTKPEAGRELSLKDESDIEVLAHALKRKNKRLHNHLTNEIKRLLQDRNLTEGINKETLFDIMIKNYDDNKHDLIIEVKSSTNVADVRMAIGQLYDYWYRQFGSSEMHAAVLLPEKPQAEISNLLKWLEIGLLWIADGHIHTDTSWLRRLAV